MNRLTLTMSAIAIASIAGGCGQKSDSAEDVIIERPDIEVVDGKLTPEVLEAMGRVGTAVPSPDGSLIAFTLTYESIELNKSNAEIYTVKPDGSDLRRLTKTASSESDLTWYDGGKRLAFLALDSEGSKRQIFSCDPQGEELVQMSQMENGVECFKFSPDGKKVVLASPIQSWKKDSTL